MRRRGGLRRGSHLLLWPVKAARKHAAEPLLPRGSPPLLTRTVPVPVGGTGKVVMVVYCWTLCTPV